MDFLNMSNLSNFAPHVKLMLEEFQRSLYSDDGQNKLGITPGDFLVLDQKSGCANDGQTSVIHWDRFKLKIPYGGTILNWEFIFQANYEEYPPDFIFDDKSFNPALSEIKILGCWDPKVQQCFLMLVQELLRLYKKHQLSELSMNEHIVDEFHSLVAMFPELNLKEKDFECYCDKAQNNALNLLVKLPVDFSEIPAIYDSKDKMEKVVVLFMRIVCLPHSLRANGHLELSTTAKQCLSMINPNDLRIPIFESNDESLKEYILLATSIVQEKVLMISNGFKNRMDYITAFINKFGKKVLEYDAEEFNSIAFLFELDEFFFNLLIEIPMEFPEEQPVFTFSSIYHIKTNTLSKPFSTVEKTYPYSPRWSPTEMADRACTVIMETAAIFKLESKNNST